MSARLLFDLWKRRKLKSTCPRCGLRSLARFDVREGLQGSVRTVTRFCVNCEYSDGFVAEFDPDGLIERNARSFAAGRPYILGSPR